MCDHENEQSTPAEAPIRRLSGNVIYRSEFAVICEDQIEFSDGSPGTYVTVASGNGNPGVVVVPSAHGLLGLVRVYRYPLRAWQWGFPRGFALAPDPLVTAGAELMEEMGLVGSLSLLGWITPDSGLLSSRVAVVLAEIDESDASPLDTRKVAEVAWMSLQDMQRRLGADGYDDGLTMAALPLLRCRVS
ncbi:MAG: NUDIX domain-containing protein [Propionibacteriaceae bacterium]|jgi:8-oxo-dGTP pyrophosphatase MutT (NUDIX family)|nr:NUDIX domain-containing protein [Propionibacteriaceae bacterium]